jgi:hypothetical protein
VRLRWVLLRIGAAMLTASASGLSCWIPVNRPSATNAEDDIVGSRWLPPQQLNSLPPPLPVHVTSGRILSGSLQALLFALRSTFTLTASNSAD